MLPIERSLLEELHHEFEEGVEVRFEGVADYSQEDISRWPREVRVGVNKWMARYK